MKTPCDMMILAELGGVAQVLQTACNVESLMRGEPLNPHDPRVQVRAADIILAGAGAKLRAAIEQSCGRKEEPCSD